MKKFMVVMTVINLLFVLWIASHLKSGTAAAQQGGSGLSGTGNEKMYGVIDSSGSGRIKGTTKYPVRFEGSCIVVQTKSGNEKCLCGNIFVTEGGEPF
jgi:hypothetical protein